MKKFLSATSTILLIIALIGVAASTAAAAAPAVRGAVAVVNEENDTASSFGLEGGEEFVPEEYLEEDSGRRLYYCRPPRTCCDYWSLLLCRTLCYGCS